MKKYVIIVVVGIVLVLFLYQWYAEKKYTIESTRAAFLPQLHRLQPKTRKKIVIFSGPGGQGHESAAMALTEYLEYKYDIQTVYLIQDILTPLDFIHTITGGSFHAEQFYNYCLLHHYIWVVDAMVWLGLKAFKYQHSKVKQLIKNYLVDQQPDLIISVIPAINGAACAIAYELQVPFWIIPTDLDPLLFTYQLNCTMRAQTYFNVPYDIPDLHNKVDTTLLENITITHVGFPVRRQFLMHYDVVSLKIKHQVPFDKPVIMVMMGGLGVYDTEEIVAQLSSLDGEAHLLICIGKNEKLRPKIATLLEKNDRLSYTIISFTPYIAPFMAMADLLITKSGGATVNEALYMDLPMIIDGTRSGPQWEYYNRCFVEEHNCGIIVKKNSDLSHIVSELWKDKNRLSAMKKAMQSIPRANPLHETRALVASLLYK